MRILLDHNVPVPLRYWLTEHSVETAYERGWAKLANGALLEGAEKDGFEIIITTDKGIHHQQISPDAGSHLWLSARMIGPESADSSQSWWRQSPEPFQDRSFEVEIPFA